MDIEALYTNIPQHEAWQAVRQLFDKEDGRPRLALLLSGDLVITVVVSRSFTANANEMPDFKMEVVAFGNLLSDTCDLHLLKEIGYSVRCLFGVIRSGS
ncbi:hypothetical protein NDU88_002128 [Pleurodeles waltl]|uniref:Uncharacterized protein n=1 Tax=Pleurodeles waltl TaxID=8319 RepID=A0AAV7LDE2_PLEWA|nr:hypothetical protein NDU88_002128 [Pleurodeles waltl]